VEFPPGKKLIPIIGDSHVEFEFGTGVLKVTPAHDKADFEIGARHSLPVVDIMNPDGTMNELAGQDLAGLDRFEAREAAIRKLEELGAMVKEEVYEHSIGYSERTNIPVEPRLSDQWFLRYPAAAESTEAVRSGAIAFRPERWASVFEHWMGNIQDWCISRQLWWGHRIPVWYSKTNPGDPPYVGIEAPTDAERARYLVFIVALAFPDHGRADTRQILSHRRPGDRAGHHFLLGGAHDHGGVRVHGAEAVLERLLHRAHPGRPGAENVEIARQFPRSARADRQIRRGRPALRPYADRAAGAGHPL
jgi:valyl-tRNA synthetase